jgi:lysophospholipase L1-like esterase
MKITQAILLALAVLTGCTKKTEVAAASKYIDTSTTTPTAGTYTYLALGDSYTIGESVPASQSYPIQLANALNGNGVYVPQQPNIIAVTGWTTGNLINAIAANDISRNGTKYSFVTLLIGVNDQFQGLGQDEYRTNFVQLLHTAISFANGDSTRVFVISIPDYGVTPFGKNGRGEAVIGPEIDQFNAINKQESIKAGVNYLDITPISRQAATDPSLVADDGLHPSGKMYTLWVQLLEPMVAARLGKK